MADQNSGAEEGIKGTVEEVKGKAKALKVYDVKPKATPKRRTAATAKKAPARSSRRKSPATQKT